jgi:outer membrane protein TolC
MILVLALAVQAAAADSIPSITLEEAVRRARNIDPGYVAAATRVDDAVWGRRAAWSSMLLPNVTASSSLTESTSEFFNVGTGQLASRIIEARLTANYELFRGGGKLFDLRRSTADLERARALEVDADFSARFATESAYYDVLAQRELARVAEERVRRAEEQLAVARARVLSGAAVQTDSLQVLLELTRARVERLRQHATLRVARLELGRRVGIAGLVDAEPLGPLPDMDLPLDEEEAVREALARGPDYRAAVAGERAADAAVKAERGSYLPQVSLFGQWSGFDETFFPSATTRTSYGVSVSFPLWNGAQRELALARARSTREAAAATRRDTELAVRRDVIEAYEAYRTARASTDLAAEAVAVATENLRVQQTRYRAGATTILDLLTAQVDLAQAEAVLVQERQSTRLALATLESLLGRRLFEEQRENTEG